MYRFSTGLGPEKVLSLSLTFLLLVLTNRSIWIVEAQTNSAPGAMGSEWHLEDQHLLPARAAIVAPLHSGDPVIKLLARLTRKINSGNMTVAMRGVISIIVRQVR
jgi:hypothetical protein